MTEVRDRELVAQYVLSWRASGHFLPYEDYSVIDKWLASGVAIESLIRALSELLPELYADSARSKIPPPLRLIEQKVARKLVQKRS